MNIQNILHPSTNDDETELCSDTSAEWSSKYDWSTLCMKACAFNSPICTDVNMSAAIVESTLVAPAADSTEECMTMKHPNWESFFNYMEG